MFRSSARSALLVFLFFSSACGIWTDERSEIKTRLRELVSIVNTTAAGDVNGLTRAVRIGSFFTDDVVVELGEGSTPIVGRDTLIGMTTRLEPRIADFSLGFTDATVDVSDDKETAQVSLTVEFIRRHPDTRQTMDAREFKLGMRRVEGEWRIARATAIDTLK
jgi:hypothetical protein